VILKQLKKTPFGGRGRTSKTADVEVTFLFEKRGVFFQLRTNEAPSIVQQTWGLLLANEGKVTPQRGFPFCGGTEGSAAVCLRANGWYLNEQRSGKNVRIVT